MKQSFFPFFLYSTLIIFLVGCSSANKKTLSSSDPMLTILSRTYRVPYEYIWQAVEKETDNLEIQFKDKNQGLLQTRWVDITDENEWVNGDNAKFSSIRMKLLVELRTVDYKDKDAVRLVLFVNQQGRPKKSKDNVDEWIDLRSTQIYEKLYLYRIERRIKLGLFEYLLKKKLKEKQRMKKST